MVILEALEFIMSVETKSPGQGCWYDISPAGLQLRAVDLLVEPLANS
jgi:hypothetical protein